MHKKNILDEELINFLKLNELMSLRGKLTLSKITNIDELEYFVTYNTIDEMVKVHSFRIGEIQKIKVCIQTYQECVGFFSKLDPTKKNNYRYKSRDFFGVLLPNDDLVNNNNNDNDNKKKGLKLSSKQNSLNPNNKTKDFIEERKSKEDRDNLLGFFNQNQIFSSIDNIIEMDLADRELTDFPGGLYCCKNLNKIIFSDNSIASIAPDISKATSIKEIHLSNNVIKNFEPLCRLPFLIELNLETNDIDVVPEAIRYLSSLEVLDLSSNSISVLPDTISELKNLKELILDQNMIKVFGPLSELENLEQLYLSENQISHLEISYFDKLNNLITFQFLSNPFKISSSFPLKIKNLII